MLDDMPDMDDATFKEETRICADMALRAIQQAMCEYMSRCYDTKDFRASVLGLDAAMEFLHSEHRKFMAVLCETSNFEELQKHYELSDADVQMGQLRLQATRVRLATQQN